jgi:aspartate/methionine/tyrosine aminotransferase
MTLNALLPTANPLVVDTGSPPIPEAAGWLAAYDGRHGPALRLSQAAPGSPPPPAMLEQLAAAARDPLTAAYGPIAGDAPLLTLYAAALSRLYGCGIDAAQCAITTGCNQAFMVALLAVARAGDAILLPEPWYFNHEMTARMLGIEARPLPCHAEAGFVPSLDDARALLGDRRVRAIVLVTPNNPTGAIYPPETIRAFAALAVEYGCWLILDETYRDFLDQPGVSPHSVLADRDLAHATIQLYSFSKSYAVPGYRLGALMAPAGLMPEVAKILDCLQICAPRVGQRALTWALPALGDWREQNRVVMVERGLAFRRVMAQVGGWKIRSLGAYFAYVEHPFPGVAAVDVVRALACDRGILALPGTYFGSAQQKRYLRFAFGNADAATIAGVADRLHPRNLVTAP